MDPQLLKGRLHKALNGVYAELLQLCGDDHQGSGFTSAVALFLLGSFDFSPISIFKSQTRLGDGKMRKQKKNIAAGAPEPLAGAPGKSFSAQSDFPKDKNRLAGDDGKTLGTAKKEISGAWILAFLILLLVLLLVQHWLRQ